MKRHNSFIIILEGIDGSGKHTLATALRDYILVNKSSFEYDSFGIEDVKLFSFPDYTGLCSKILKKMLSSEQTDHSTIAALFALDRKLQDTDEDHPKTVKIFDRYYQSNLVYNPDLPIEDLLSLERDSYIGDVVFILDIDPKISFERRPHRRDNYENDLEKMVKARQRYLELAHKFGWIILNGEDSTINLLEEIIVHCCYKMNHGLKNIYHDEPSYEGYILT